MINKKDLTEADIRDLYISPSIENIRSTAFTLLPKSIQTHIVSKIEELFTICDQLKENIIKSEDIKVKLADSVVGG